MTPPADLAAAAVERGAQQQTDELAELVTFLQGRRVRDVLEVGVYHGGTLWLWRQLAAPAGFVLGVDVTAPACIACERRRAHADCPRQLLARNIGEPGGAEAELLLADSGTPKTLGLVKHYFPSGVDFLHIDGDHSLAGATRDLALYGPLVKPGGVLAMHDVAAIYGGLDVPGGRTLPFDEYGPALLWENLRGTAGAFTIDRGGYGFGVLA